MDLRLYCLTCLFVANPLHDMLLNQKQRVEMKVAFRVVVFVSYVELDFQEDTLDIANWSIPLQMKFQLNGRMPSLQK